jgi:hypothetical protein
MGFVRKQPSHVRHARTRSYEALVMQLINEICAQVGRRGIVASAPSAMRQTKDS